MSDGQCTVRGSRQSGGCRRAAAAAAASSSSPHLTPSLLSRPTMQLYAPSSRVHQPPPSPHLSRPHSLSLSLSVFFHCFRRFLPPSSTLRVRAHVCLSPALFSATRLRALRLYLQGWGTAFYPAFSPPWILTYFSSEEFGNSTQRDPGTMELGRVAGF